MTTGYILYWILTSYISGSAQLSSGAIRVDSLEACMKGAQALNDMHTGSDDTTESDEFNFRCEKAK